MSRTLTAMYDTRADAEAGQKRLTDAHIDVAHVKIHDESSVGNKTGAYSTHQNLGMWGSTKNALLPDEDRHTYEEGVRRGSFLLTADVDEHEADKAVRALEQTDGIDIDKRSGDWKAQGWDYASSNALGTLPSGNTAAKSAVGEEKLQVVEEQLVVGKREVERGGVRVRSYVTEKPVHEQIRLREERVAVERRPVDRKVEAGDDAFRHRTIAMTETAEEAVVGKTARVVEEVVVKKTAGTRVEEIDDTVRRTDVEVEKLPGSAKKIG